MLFLGVSHLSMNMHGKPGAGMAVTGGTFPGFLFFVNGVPQSNESGEFSRN